jgi:hypothetical protein
MAVCEALKLYWTSEAQCVKGGEYPIGSRLTRSLGFVLHLGHEILLTTNHINVLPKRHTLSVFHVLSFLANQVTSIFGCEIRKKAARDKHRREDTEREVRTRMK